MLKDVILVCGPFPEQKYSLSQRVQIELALAFQNLGCDAHFPWLCHHS